MPSERARRGTPRRRSKPSTALAEHWTTLDGVSVFYRESPGPADGVDDPDAPGFARSYELHRGTLLPPASGD